MSINNNKDLRELKKLLSKMSDQQLRQYMTIQILLLIPYLSNDFMEKSNRKTVGYLSEFIYSLVKAILIQFTYEGIPFFSIHRDTNTNVLFRAFSRVCALDSSRSKALTVNDSLDRAFEFALDPDVDPDFDYTLAFAISRALDLDVSLFRYYRYRSKYRSATYYRNLVRDRAINFALDLDLALDIALHRDLTLAFDIAINRNLALDIAKDRNREYDRTFRLELARFMLSNVASKLTFQEIWKKGFTNHDTYQYVTFIESLQKLPNKLEPFKYYLHKGAANARISVWADLFEQMFYKKLDDNVIKALLTLKEKDIDATVAESSEVLYSYLHSGISNKYEMRLIILGEKGHGKTAFRSRFMNLNGHFPKQENTTEGVDFETFAIPDSEKEVSIKFWDFAGDTVTHEAHKYFLSERAVYVIVYGTRQENGEISKWLEHIKDFASIRNGRKPKIFILVNLLRSEATGKDVKVTINEDQLRQNYRNDFELEFDYMNLKYDNEADGKIDTYRRKIEDYILTLDTKVPEDYVKIYDKMENESNNCFIEVPKMKKIITDTIGSYSDEILMALHRFAFFFYYPDEGETNDSNRVILKPEWITHAVYKIIRYAYDHNGVINRKQIQEALRQEDQENPERDREFIYQRESIQWIERTLVHFQIAYESQDKFVFPMCLKLQYDGNKTTFLFDETNSFQVYFTIPMKGTEIRQQLPKDIVSTLIISDHKSLVMEDGITLTARTQARFGNGKAQVEILRLDDYNLYMIGQGNAFEDYAEIVIDYAQKMQKHLIDNYSRFERDMPKITVAYSKDTIEGVPISRVRQSIIDRIQNGFEVKKELSILQMFEKIDRKTDLLDNIDRNTSDTNRLLRSDVLKLFDEMKRQLDILQKTVEDYKGKNTKELQNNTELMVMCLDSFLAASEKNDLAKSKSALVKLGELSGNVLLDGTIKAVFTTAIGTFGPLLPDIIQDMLNCIRF
ncbi:MAG: hypothetical protein LBM69_04550 [Lachnospiraceae bacterium]|jgi:GTPase SAR1 family protein|nr:hypothetical protein [Lachnospiraceae bacterium]